MHTAFDNPVTVPEPAGHYSHVARLNLGQGVLLWVSGQLALDHDHLIVGPGDMTAQTRRVFEILGAILAAHGASFKDVVNIRSYLVDMDRVDEYGVVRREYLRGEVPSSTTVGVTTLVIPGALVEIDVTAVVGCVGDSANGTS
jgi:enamine deaminase RidA (YjgF/YER057c/UK114 family)